MCPKNAICKVVVLSVLVSCPKCWNSEMKQLLSGANINKIGEPFPWIWAIEHTVNMIINGFS